MEVFEKVTQEVASCMHSMEIIKTPVLEFTDGDKGLFDSFFELYANDAQVNEIKAVYGKETYLMLLSSHALGLGGYTTICQTYFGKKVAEWSLPEVNQINADIRSTDPYELFLNALEYTVDSENKACLDQIIQTAVIAFIDSAMGEWENKENLKVLMKILYNAGIAVAKYEN